MKDFDTKIKAGYCTFNDAEITSGLKQKRKLSSFINHLIFHFTKKFNQVSYTFVSDEELLKMNKQYLQHDTYTDIITFDLSDKKSTFILADIYISIDRVKENARLLNVTYQDELLRVIVHGALHVSGFNDKTKKEKENMRMLETKWMEEFHNSTISQFDNFTKSQ